MEYIDELTQFMQEMEPYRVKLIEFQRDFIKNLILLSAGIVGFSIPILDKTQIIKNYFLFGLSLSLFVVVIIVGVLYIFFIIKKETKFLMEFPKVFTKIFQKIDSGNLSEEVVKSVGEDFNKPFKNDVKQVKIFNKLYQINVFLFIGALIIMILSIFC